MMNHDYAHCLDYDPNKCSEACFRAQLEKDLKKRTDLIGIPLTYAHLYGSEICIRVNNRIENVSAGVSEEKEMTTDYINRKEFILSRRKAYCYNCELRKGMKNGKIKVLYEIGEAPCRACSIGDVLDDIEDYPSADVQPVVYCKDCKWFKIPDNTTHMITICHKYSGVRSDFDFCSRGERK